MAQGVTSREGELSPGDLCDGYRILSLIAAGGMGDVYEAVHEASGRTVAVKCLKVRHRNKEDARARMKMEAVVLAELQHANLVQVYDAGVNDAGMVWIAMERLHGQTLREILHRSGALSIPDALYYASEIADGVDAVHEVNVIHRDLKPENVFVTTRKVVKVLDLGTGKFTGYGLNSTDRMKVIGTTAYMSPEQIKGLRVDPRADVYALGIMAYEMIAGRHPLAADDGIFGLPRAIEQVALMQLQMTPKPLADLAPHCPPYIAAIVHKALVKDREQRYASMTAFSRELRTARKRFIAENGLDDSPRDLLGAGDRVREKLGAPPRSSSPPPVRAPLRPASEGASELATSATANLRDAETAPEHAAAAIEALATEIQPAREFTAGGLTPVPADYVETLHLSSSSLPAHPPDAFAPDVTYRDIPSEVRNQTTHTNPLLPARASDWTPEPQLVPKRNSLLGVWTHPVVRRMAVTLALGALLGVPPAVLGVWWARHRAGAQTPMSSDALGARAATPTNTPLGEVKAGSPEPAATGSSLADTTGPVPAAPAAPTAAPAAPTGSSANPTGRDPVPVASTTTGAAVPTRATGSSPAPPSGPPPKRTAKPAPNPGKVYLPPSGL